MENAFRDRADAGRVLAERLETFRSSDPVVVGIAPGGVPLAYEIARSLGAPLEAWAVRQLHAANAEETHVGAIAEDHPHHFSLGLAGNGSHHGIHALADAERDALIHAAEHLRTHARTSMRNRTVLLVDDGLATGATVRAAVHAIRQEKPHRVIVAVPVVVRGGLPNVDRWVDDIVWIRECETLPEIGAAYARFEKVEDAVAAELLERRRHEVAARPASAPPAWRSGTRG